MKNLKAFGYGMFEGAMIGVIGLGVCEISQGNFFQTSTPVYATYTGILASSLVGGFMNLARNKKDITDTLKTD